METGVPGVLSQTAVPTVGEEPTIEQDFATLLRHIMVDLSALDQAQKQQLAMNSIALLVKQIVALVYYRGHYYQGC
jgi:hypothetical protein